MASDLLSELVHNFDSERWNEFDLQILTVTELQAISSLLYVSKSGTKQQLIVKILATRQLRNKLAPYSPDREGALELSKAHRAEDIRAMCKEAVIWRSGNKLANAVCLIQWRERCRMEGMRFYREIQALCSSQPQQLRLAI